MRVFLIFLFFNFAFADLLEESIINMPELSDSDKIAEFSNKFAKKENDFIFNQSFSKNNDEESLNIDFKAFLDDNFFVTNTLNLHKKYYNKGYYLDKNLPNNSISFDHYYAGFRGDDGSYALAGYQPMDVFFSASTSANGVKLHNNSFDIFNFGVFAFDVSSHDDIDGAILGLSAGADLDNLSATSAFARFGKVVDIWALDIIAKHEIMDTKLSARANISHSNPNNFDYIVSDFEKSQFLAFELGVDTEFFEASGGYLNFGKKDARSFHSLDQHGAFIKAGSELLDYFKINGKHDAYFAKAKVKSAMFSLGLDYVRENVSNITLPNQKNQEFVASAGFTPTKGLSFNLLYSLTHKKEQENKEKKDKIQLDTSYKF